MSNDVANCPYCDEGLIVEGYGDTHCDRCGRLVKYDEETLKALYRDDFYSYMEC